MSMNEQDKALALQVADEMGIGSSAELRDFAARFHAAKLEQMAGKSFEELFPEPTEYFDPAKTGGSPWEETPNHRHWSSKREGFQAGAASNATRIAELEAEVERLNKVTNKNFIDWVKKLIASEAEAKRLRDALNAILNSELTRIGIPQYNQAKEALSTPTNTAAFDAMVADAERLDWIIGHPDATICNGGPTGPYHVWFRYSNRTTPEAATPRAAIDAARHNADGKEEGK